MAHVLLSVLLVAVLISPTTAAAAPIKIELRLVPGDSMHYTQVAHTTLSTSTGGPSSFDSTMGMALSVESAFDDGSVSIREMIDRFDVGSGDAENGDSSPFIGAEFTFTMHPDGSVSDFQVDSGTTSLTAYGTATSFNASFPPSGIEVGQSYDAMTSLPIGLPGLEVPTVPVHAKLDALVIEQDRPSARVLQVVKVPEFEMPFGPFGASGTARLSSDGSSTYFLALDTGWPVRVDSVTSYSLTVKAEGQMQTVNARTESQFVLDDQTLNEE